MALIALGAGVTAVGLFSAPARAETILDTFGNNWKTKGGNWSVNRFKNEQELAVKFTVAAPVVVDSITTSLHTYHASIFGAAKFVLSVVKDVDGSPGAKEDSVFSTVLANPTNRRTMLGGLALALPVGTYWIRADQIGGFGTGIWQGGHANVADWSSGASEVWTPYFGGAADAPGVRILTVEPAADPEPAR